MCGGLRAQVVADGAGTHVVDLGEQIALLIDAHDRVGVRCGERIVVAFVDAHLHCAEGSLRECLLGEHVRRLEHAEHLTTRMRERGPAVAHRLRARCAELLRVAREVGDGLAPLVDGASMAEAIGYVERRRVCRLALQQGVVAAVPALRAMGEPGVGVACARGASVGVCVFEGPPPRT